MNRIIIYLVFLIVIGCEQDAKHYENVETVKFSFNDENPPYNEVFKETKIISLETNENCLIAEISQMEIWQNKFFILDCKLNALSVFDADGKYLYRIGRLGKGPGEYIRPRYFYIDKNEESIKIFDAPTKKLMCFNILGKLTKEIKLKNYLRAIGSTNSGYWGFCPNKENSEVDEEQKKYVKFILFNSVGKVKDYVKGEKSIDQLNFSNTYIASRFGDSISFVEPYLPYIYSLNDGQISIKYNIDYSGCFPSRKILNRVDEMKRPLNRSERKLLDDLGEKYVSKFMRFYENENWLFLFTAFKGTSLFYNKKTKKTIEISKYIHSMDTWETYLPSCCYIEGNSLYNQLNYQSAKWLFEATADKSIKRADDLKLLLNSMKFDDNPVIVKYTLNDE